MQSGKANSAAIDPSAPAQLGGIQNLSFTCTPGKIQPSEPACSSLVLL